MKSNDLLPLSLSDEPEREWSLPGRSGFIVRTLHSSTAT